MLKLSNIAKSLLKHRFVVLLCALALGLFVMVLSVVIYSEWKLSRLVPGGLGESFPTKVYSSPFVINNRSHHTPDELFQHLVRLNYQRTSAEPPAAGQYNWDAPVLTISLRGFKSPVMNQDAGIIKLSQMNTDVWSVTSGTGAIVYQVALEPELLAELSGPKKVRREPAAWNDFPPALIEAVVAVEDRRFYKHHGIDARAILRAAWFNVRHQKNLQGGSTITQQLAKNFFLSRERTLQRKLLEAAFAVYLDLRFPKEQILTLYLNQIYMGQDGAVSVAGVRAASQFYFGKDVRQLSLAESATLAGLIQSPYRYNPFQNSEAAQKRRDTVLKIMLEEGAITEPAFETTKALPLGVRKHFNSLPGTNSDNDYFVAEVIRQLVPRFNEDVLFRYGLKIYTTLDPLLQRKAQRLVAASPNQATLIAMDPASGRVLALVGGKNYRESQFNRATQAHRQPGSAFKPFVYGAALERGFTLASLLQDEPRAYSDGKSIWAPQNFDGVYRGSVTLREALALSINGATLDLASKLGLDPIVRFARKMGIESPLEKSLALALGASEVIPLELTAAYAPFANGGFRVSPLFVAAVLDSEENILELNNLDREAVLEPAFSYLMTSLLQTPVTEGTARSLNTMGWHLPTAGKTGTTNRGKDAWFIGYTADLLVGVWVGNDDARPVNLAGAKNALPLWARFMESIYNGRSAMSFEKPKGLVTVTLDPTSGLLARSGCPDQKEELFIAGTQPTQYCSVHAGGLKGWLLRIFRKKPSPLPDKQTE